MAKKAVQQPVHLDCVEEALHPRLTHRLIGQDGPLSVMARAIRAGLPPGGWLISGPPGVGKATLAYRIARYLLAYGATDQGPADLSVPPHLHDAQLIAAGAHPGLLVLRRGINPDTGKPMTVLSVDEVRKLGSFFGMTAGAGGWRVALIDTADDMNDAAANALLKLLEEPPARAMILVLAHAPGRMLPTIRSRCQKIALRPLSDAAMDAELKNLAPDIPAEERGGLIALSGGSLGAALRLAGSDGLMLADAANRLIDEAKTPNVSALYTLAEKVGRIADGQTMLGDFLLQSLSRRIRSRALTDTSDLRPWLKVHEELAARFARSGALHLDPRQLLLGTARHLSGASRRAGML
ncbi:MAG: DNA polymerase III subunit delta' [Rhizomicrobium sp.]